MPGASPSPGPSPDLLDDLRLALAAADLADRLTLARFRSGDLRVRAKPDRSPVTDADLAVEAAIRELLSRERPADAVLGEEQGGRLPATGRVWVLDPIDGTKNFLRGGPVWATLVALLADGEPVVGVASAPALGCRWWAALGHGAFGSTPAAPVARRLAVSAVASLSDAYCSTTDLSSWAKYRTRESYLRLVDACWETRAFGDFWQHCLVAEGAIDLACEPIVNIWDVAPLKILVEEAGGRFTDLAGTPTVTTGTALSTNSHLHPAALTCLATL